MQNSYTNGSHSIKWSGEKDPSIHDWYETKNKIRLKEDLAVPLLGGDSNNIHPIRKEYNDLKKHTIKTLRDMVGRQSKISDTKELRSKDHAISTYLRNKHGDKKVDAAFKEQTSPYDGGVDMTGAPRSTFPSFSVDVNTGRNV